MIYEKWDQRIFYKGDAMNVLGVGAHFDDLEMGCGGTLARHSESGDSVMMVVVTNSAYKSLDGETIRNAETALREGKKAAKFINAELICLDYDTLMVAFDDEFTQKLMRIIEKNDINTIYTNWVHDIHRDHRLTSRASMMAGRHVQRFFMYRSNFYDTEEPFRGAFYSDISDVIDKKIEMIKVYESELKRVNYRWLDFILKQNANDGQKIGVKYSERFEVIRYLA
jgi:LmbE family N-acetylglucosaminyl deacetylase